MRLATSNTAARATRTSSNTLSPALASSTEQPESCAGVRDKTDWPWDLTSRRFPADRTAGVLLYAVCSADSLISHLGVAPSSDCDIGYFLLSSDVFSLQLSPVPCFRFQFQFQSPPPSPNLYANPSSLSP